MNITALQPQFCLLEQRLCPWKLVQFQTVPHRILSVSYTHLDVYKRQQEDRIEVEELLYSTEANILQLIETFNVQTESQVLTSNMQLKPISLPCFTGNILEWQHFYSIFLDLVHARSDLTSVQKLHYLYSSLKNEPLDLIKALPICNENYSIAEFAVR